MRAHAALCLVTVLAVPAAAQEAVFVHVATAANSPSGEHYTILDHPLLNGRPDAKLLITQNWKPPGGSGVFNDHPVAVYYRVGFARWTIENQDVGTMPLGAAFNVWVPADRPGGPFVHTTTGPNTTLNYTHLDHPFLNGFPGTGRPLAVTVIAPHTLFPHDVGVWYDESVDRWTIFNQDQQAMPAGVSFFVCPFNCEIFDGEGQGFAPYTISAGDVEGYEAQLGDGGPGLSSHSFALLTLHWDGVYVDSPTGYYWDLVQGRTVLRQDQQEMPTGVPLVLLFTPGIFASGFETGDFRGWLVVGGP